MDYLKEQDDKMCMKILGRKPFMFFNIGFITFDNTNNPKCNKKSQSALEGRTFLI
jgi:hypothetical protein